MRRVVASMIALSVLVAGCAGRTGVLTREDGAEWDGHLSVGQTVTIGAVVVNDGPAGYHVQPAIGLVVEDPTVGALTPGPFGHALRGLRRGETTLHIYTGGGYTEPADVAIVVE